MAAASFNYKIHAASLYLVVRSSTIGSPLQIAPDRLSVHFLSFPYLPQLKYNYKCGPMPNVMVALPNIGGALCSTPQSLANAH